VAKKVRSSFHDVEVSNEELGRLLELVARTPEGDVRKLAVAEGFPLKVIDRFLKLMRKDHAGLGAAVKSLGHNEMVSALTEKMSMALHHLDAGKFETANAQQIAIVFGILAEKRELLQGKPTQIFSFEERKSMREMLPNALKEAQRRGMTFDGTFTEDRSVEPRLIQGEQTAGAFNKTDSFERHLPTEKKDGV
jgi:hypothetical protein